MTMQELKKYTVDFMNNETGSNRSNLNSVMGKMLIKYAEIFQKRIAELEAQIEKMKNCKNCANYMIIGKCPCLFRTGWCKNWEFAK